MLPISTSWSASSPSTEIHAVSKDAGAICVPLLFTSTSKVMLFPALAASGAVIFSMTRFAAGVE